MPGFALSYKNEGTVCRDVPIMKMCYKKIITPGHPRKPQDAFIDTPGTFIFYILIHFELEMCSWPR